MARGARRWTQHNISFDWWSSVQAWHTCVSCEGLQRTEPVKKVLVLLPAWKRLDRRRLIDFLKRVSFHFQIGPRINLSRFDIHMAKEVADHVERDSALQ